MNTIDYHKSAELKLKLLLSGIRIEDDALSGLGDIYKEYQYGYNDSNWVKQSPKQIIPSEIVLPGRIVVAPHLRPSSPYIIKKYEGNLYIVNALRDEMVSPVEYLPRPTIWSRKLNNGASVKEYLNVYGADCLNLFIVADCEFWREGIPCVFCSLQPTQALHKEVVMFKSLDRIEEAVSIAFNSNTSFKWMIITGGSLRNRDNEVKRYCEVLNTIKKYIPPSWNNKIKGNAALLPTNKEDDLVNLFHTGIEHPSFNLEVWGKTRFVDYCKGKEKYASFDYLIDTYKKAVKIWGVGNVWCNFVGGISPIKDLIQGFYFMADMGVVPGANIFHLDPKAVGVKMGLKEPDEEYVMQMYSALSNIYKQYGYKPFFSESVLRNSLSNEMYNGWIGY